jgi:signal transduction histidine kinase
MIGARTALRQVCMNLLVNAIEAMPDGGILKVASTALDKNIYVEITDQGVGITADELNRVLDPWHWFSWMGYVEY